MVHLSFDRWSLDPKLNRKTGVGLVVLGTSMYTTDGESGSRHVQLQLDSHALCLHES
jgi:hypothetical protein